MFVYIANPVAEIGNKGWSVSGTAHALTGEILRELTVGAEVDLLFLWEDQKRSGKGVVSASDDGQASFTGVGELS